jgi:hypothetical protein
MERQPIFRDRYEVTDEDLEKLTAWSQESSDHVGLDAIDAGRKFTGFVVSQSTSTAITVGAGRLWYNGERYFDDTVGGYPLDLTGKKPDLLSVVVAIVVTPETVETHNEQRDYETDAETGTKEPRDVNVERRRRARFEAVAGIEAVSPAAPVLPDTAVVVALVRMGTGGIERITRNTDRVLPNLADVAGRTRGLESWRTGAEPIIAGVQGQLGALAAQLAGQANRRLLIDIASDVAIIRKKLSLPDTYAGERGDDFTDLTYTDTAAVGYAARVEEGLRLPYEAEDEVELGLQNIYDPKLKVTGTGLCLPAWTAIEDRVVRGAAGELNLASYASEPRTFTKLAMSQARARFGADFEVSTGSAFYQTGTYLGRLNGSFRTIFAKDGVPYQQYETGEVDPDRYKIVRLSKLWTDQVTEPYWARYVTTEVVNGYAHCETFFNQHDRWIVGMTPWIHQKPAEGNLTFGICGTYRGEPDFDQVLYMATKAPADVKLANAAGPNDLMTPIEPTFLKGGRYYTYFVSTPAGYIHAVADEQNPHSGTYFYGLNGGQWFAQPGTHLIFSLWQAAFGTTLVEAVMLPLSLAGGIQGIDVQAEMIVPDDGDVVWSVFVNNGWRQFSPDTPNPLTTPFPNVVPFKASFVGTNAAMPAIRLPGSVARLSRLALAGKHVSTPKALATPVNAVTKRIRLFPGWDPARHSATITLKRGATTETADTVVDEPQVDGSIERVATFNLGAPASSYVSIVDYSTDTRLNAPVIKESVEIATV